MSEWRPIETAPKDGTRIWCWFHYDDEDSGAYAVRWDRNEYEESKNWTLDDGESATLSYDPPTHWMPLPQPPNTHSPEARECLRAYKDKLYEVFNGRVPR